MRHNPSDHGGRGNAGGKDAGERDRRKEERRMAARHDGHITRAEQAKLNRQENAVSKQIGQ